MTVRVRAALVTLLMLAVVLIPSLATPQGAEAANPWRKSLNITVNGRVVGVVTCSVSWVRSGADYQDSITCTATDKYADGKGVYVRFALRTSPSADWGTISWSGVGSSYCKNTAGANTTKSCSKSGRAPAKNYYALIQYGLTDGGQIASIANKTYSNVPGR